MNLNPATDPTFARLSEPQACSECHTVSRLTNGLCLNCLLHVALDTEKDTNASGRDAFREVLAGVKSGGGDWRIADHEILEEIARGGMGVVYQAKEPHSGRVVALKCVLAYQDESDHAVARFRREAETAARLEHPNIVPIYQVGETADGFPYYTMKYAAAGSLLQARQPLLEHPRQSAALIVKVARAVHFAHEHGVLHRDLKPGNILLDGHGEPLVSDFGLARCDSIFGYLTRSLSSFGTPGYIAPEQADGPAAKLTPAADVYSLGAILFELLTGRTPFVGDNAFAVMKQSAEEPAPTVRSLAPRIDRDLEMICAHCLEREPTDRYQTAAELADDLQNWLDDRPIRARAPSVGVQARRWVRRNRGLTVALASLLLIAGGSLVWQLRTQSVQAAMRETVLAARTVIVLPFLDLDTAESDEAATGAIGKSLSAQFETLGPARVILSPLPSWSRPQEIRKTAQDAKGRAVVSGTIRNVDGKRRISLRVFDPISGKSLLRTAIEEKEVRPGSAHKADGWVQNIYKILTAEKWPNLDGSDPGERNEKAREAMTSGRGWMNSYTLSYLDHAIVLFRQAIEEQPDSSLAHAYLAIAATSRTHFVADFSYLELGKTEALKALDLDKNSPVAHRALAGVYYQEGKFHEAVEEQMRTLELGGPEQRIVGFVGATLDLLGRPDRALSWYRIGRQLEEQPGQLEPLIGDSWTKLGNDDEALSVYERAIELRPGSAEGAIGKARLHMLRGEFDSAREICLNRLRNNDLGEMAQIAAQIEFFAGECRAADELYSHLLQADPDGGGSFYGAVSYRSALGRTKQALGAGDAAAALLQESLAEEKAILNRQPSNPEAAYRVAAAEASLNQTAAAFQHLHQAVALGWLDYRSLQRDPRFDSLRNNPELNTLIDGLSAKVAELRSNTKVK